MTDVPYFKPPEEGPLFPDEVTELVEDAETFLRASDRDVETAVAQQNRKNMSERSYKLWLQGKLEEMGVKPTESEE